ncbi:MAG: hypothetical protein IKO93_19245 [Lentisphaeria bacterium]|nr:hypothetical protein [Lentisphaeria bacterium]
MIETGGGTVNILYADGTSAFFDPEELRLRLEKSFAASGRTDPAVAGEIVLAVEYALSCRDTENTDSGSVIHAGEIDECVVRILEDTGYPDAARHFRETRVSSGDFGKLTLDGVEQYLAEKLQLSGPAGSELAAKIRNALSAIGAEQCSPRLVLELARHFRDTAASTHRLGVPPAAKAAPPPEPVQEPDVLQIRRSDKIFASIRAEIDLPQVFAKCTLTPPLTELALAPILMPLAERLDTEYASLRKDGAENYPLVLTFRGFADFAAKWLAYDPDISKETMHKRGRVFAAYFSSLLRKRPFKTFLR